MKNILEDLEILILQNEDDFDKGRGKFILRNFIKEKQAEQLTLTDVVSSFITADDEGKYFVVNTDYDDEIEKGSTVYLLRTYLEDIHLFTDKNGDEVWIFADDVDRKE